MLLKHPLANLRPRHPLPPRLLEHGEYLIRVFVAGGGAEDPARGLRAVSPQRHGGVVMRGTDDVARVEQCVDGGEPHDLRLAAAGDVAEQAGTFGGEERVDGAPEVARLLVAAQPGARWIGCIRRRLALPWRNRPHRPRMSDALRIVSCVEAPVSAVLTSMPCTLDEIEELDFL